MEKRSLKILVTVIGATMVGMTHGQLVVNPALTPTQLVQDVLLGSGVTVSNITYNGVPQPGTAQPGSASFTQVGDLGIDSGVLLSTGFPASAIGPSDNFSSDDIGNNGNDPDLEAIMGGNLTNYSILEFDFVPVGDSVKFNYVFASEEYPTFVCSFNDAFGFFLSGPGISGPYSNGAINIAVLPDGVTPVTIANVNSGQGNDPNNPTCPAVNPEYYVNNSVGQTVAFGGMTVVLTARSAVQCGQTYHIKLAIADAGGTFGDTDTAYDSAVFLEGGSFTSAPFVPSLTPGPGIVGNTMFESCFPMELTFLRVGEVTEADTFQVTYSGTFTNGLDIVPALPEEVIFAAGESTNLFTFNAPIDEDTDETIIITVVGISCIGDTIENVFVFNIAEAPFLIAEGTPFSVDCGGAVEISPTVSGGYGNYTFEWGNGLGTDPTILVAPLSDTSYPVTIFDNCGLSTFTEVPVTVIPAPNPFSVTVAPSPTVTGNSIQESCYEVTFNFARSGGTAYPDTIYLNYNGQAEVGTDFDPLPDQIIFAVGESMVSHTTTFFQDPDGLESLILSLGDVSICNGGFSIADFTFQITQAQALVTTGASPTIACGASTTLTAVATGGYAPYTFEWPDASTGNTYVVSPTAVTSYAVEVTDDCGNTAVATFNVGLLPAPPLNMSIQGPNTVTEACGSTTINIIRPLAVQGALTLDMTYAGGASNGVDFDQPLQRIIPDGVLNIQVPFEPLEDGVDDDGEMAIITASFTDACGRTVSASVTITILDAPEILVVTDGDQVVECSPDSVPIVATASGGFGGLVLTWSTGAEGSVAYGSTELGATYVVTATDACGRTATASATIIVECDIIVPNVFTPNNDGQNDRFVIEGITSTTNTVKVFNRWGQVVFEANNYRNNWAAIDVPDGTYFYEVVVDRHDKPYTGHVTILRK